MQANLVEVFSSIQGEGPHVGASTIFVRFGGCDLRCAWCDSAHTWLPSKRCRLEVERGSGRFREVACPVELPDVLAAIESLGPAAHRFVSFTGGEPLLQANAVEALARSLHGQGARLYLETHGLAAEELESVVAHFDVVSMDWKLASDVRPAAGRDANDDFGPQHGRFLKTARRAPEVFVKVVVTTRSEDDEVLGVARCIADQDPRIPLILQPVTPLRTGPGRPEASRLLALAASLEEILAEVRVIPQTHPLYGVP